MCVGLLLFACTASKGGLGQACNEQSGASFGTVTFSCDTGLVCNYGLPSPTCENPNADGAGALCGDSDNCKQGLFCAPEVGGARCSALLQEGDPCPEGIGCADNLQCAKDIDGAAFCMAESVGDGGAEAGTPTDAEAGAMADAPSDGGEGGGLDATADVSAD